MFRQIFINSIIRMVVETFLVSKQNKTPYIFKDTRFLINDQMIQLSFVFLSIPGIELEISGLNDWEDVSKICRLKKSVNQLRPYILSILFKFKKPFFQCQAQEYNSNKPPKCFSAQFHHLVLGKLSNKISFSFLFLLYCITFVDLTVCPYGHFSFSIWKHKCSYPYQNIITITTKI